MQRFQVFHAYFIMFMLVAGTSMYTNCFAQQYPFVYYTPKDGLINSRVRSIKQDSKGKIYFITMGGLSIYDGARFTNYSQQEGLANALVNDVIEITPDSFLIATNAHSLNTFVKGRIGTYKTSDNFYPVVNCFFKSKSGDLYVAADEGLFLLQHSRFIPVSLINDRGEKIGNYIDRITEWKYFLLLTSWSANIKEKLIVYDTRKRKVTSIETKRPVFSTYADSENRLWVSGKEGVRLIDTTSLVNGVIKFISPPSPFQNISQFKNIAVLSDKENNLWFFDNERILKLTPDGQQQIITSEQGLRARNITGLLIDREGIMWAATDGNGVVKLANSGVELLTTINKTPLAIGCILQQEDTTWLYNNTNHCIYRFCENLVSAFPLSSKFEGVQNIFCNGDKIFLIGADYIICVREKNRSASYRNPEIIFSDKNSSLGNGFLDDQNNNVIPVRQGSDSFFIYVISHKKVVQKIPTFFITDQMAIDKTGLLWMINRNDQLLVFTRHPEDPSHYLQLYKDYSNLFKNLSPRSIMIDRKNNVWVGTRYQGIYLLHFTGYVPDTIIRFSTKDGMTDNFVYSLAYDSSGTVWAGTQTGLDKLLLRNGSYIIGNVSKNNNFFQAIHSIIVSKENTVWAITNEGAILKVSATKTRQSFQKPDFIFTDIKLNDVHYIEAGNVFSHKQNNFSFSVAALSFIDEKSIRYSYLLEGSGKSSWSEPSGQSIFNFFDLPPSNYTLKVKCNFPQEMYPSQMISYSFTIKSPWWQTWWFMTIAGLLIGGFLIALVRLYYNRKLEKAKAILEKQQAVEKERTRISIDMHDDLGAGLSRIKFLSETIGIKKQRDEPIEEDINKIRNYSNEMIDKMGEIVWALNEKNDSLSDLLSYTRSYAAEYLSQSGIRCEVDAPDTFPTDFVSGEFRRNIYLVVKEALHNIVKHAQATEVRLKIIANHHLEICIHDDGVGFDRKNIRPFSNGLTNMEKRMAEIGGSLTIDTEKGTTIHITAPFKA